MDFLLDVAYWEKLGQGLHLTGGGLSPTSPVKEQVHPSTGAEWQQSLEQYGYFKASEILGKASAAGNAAMVPGSEVEREIDNTW
jgi:hypothetical protein